MILKCPLCNDTHCIKPQNNGNVIFRVNEVRKIFGATAECPVCLEECSEIVALPCGHVLCEDDCKRLMSVMQRLPLPSTNMALSTTRDLSALHVSILCGPSMARNGSSGAAVDRAHNTSFTTGGGLGFSTLNQTLEEMHISTDSNIQLTVENQPRQQQSIATTVTSSSSSLASLLSTAVATATTEPETRPSLPLSTGSAHRDESVDASAMPSTYRGEIPRQLSTLFANDTSTTRPLSAQLNCIQQNSSMLPSRPRRGHLQVSQLVALILMYLWMLLLCPQQMEVIFHVSYRLCSRTVHFQLADSTMHCQV